MEKCKELHLAQNIILPKGGMTDVLALTQLSHNDTFLRPKEG